MNQTDYTLSRPVSLSLPVEDIDRLLAERDGNAALVYLALQRSGGAPVSPAALGLSEEQYAAALKTLERLGILKGTEPPKKEVPLPPAEELPQYTAEDLVRRTKEDSTFRGVLQHAEMLYGRKLSTPETRSLLGMQDYLGLPPEVLMELITYVFDRYRSQKGPGRSPTMRMVENEAYVWARNELLTSELAQEYILRQQQRQDRVIQLMEALELRGRVPSPTERKYLQNWADMGFTPDAVAEAYDRTVTGTGALKWAYLNKILLSWDKRGLHRLPEILENDPRGGGKRKTAPPPANTQPRNDLALAEQLLQSRRGKKEE